MMLNDDQIPHDSSPFLRSDLQQASLRSNYVIISVRAPLLFVLKRCMCIIHGHGRSPNTPKNVTICQNETWGTERVIDTPTFVYCMCVCVSKKGKKITSDGNLSRDDNMRRVLRGSKYPNKPRSSTTWDNDNHNELHRRRLPEWPGIVFVIGG